jgi:hypothetical protein
MLPRYEVLQTPDIFRYLRFQNEWVTVALSWSVRRPRQETNLSFPCSAEVKNE